MMSIINHVCFGGIIRIGIKKELFPRSRFLYDFICTIMLSRNKLSGMLLLFSFADWTLQFYSASPSVYIFEIPFCDFLCLPHCVCQDNEKCS